MTKAFGLVCGSHVADIYLPHLREPLLTRVGTGQGSDGHGVEIKFVSEAG
jgi:hypothetical protein